MKWIYTHINHFTVPFAMLLGLISAYVGYTTRKKIRAGKTPPYVPRGIQIATILLLAVGFIVFGIVLAHNYMA
jgi:hypothetical protein